MVHAMKLNPKPFKAIASGEKIYELRLYDEKRQEVKVGDTIVFTNLGNTDETITVTVLCLHLFKDFERCINRCRLNGAVIQKRSLLPPRPVIWRPIIQWRNKADTVWWLLKSL